MPYRPPPEKLEASQRQYYGRRSKRHMDPRSETEKWLEWFGQSKPFVEDAQNYDYRKQAWDESVAEGNPDMSWFLPELNDSTAKQFTGAVDYGISPQAARDAMEWAKAAPRNTIEGFLGGDQVDDRRTDRELLRRTLIDAGQIDERADIPMEAFDQALAGATPEQLAELRATRDPRTRTEKNTGALFNALDWPTLGFAGEAMAGVGSLLPGRQFQPELDRIQKIQDEYDTHEDLLSGRNVLSTGAGLAAGFGGLGALTKGIGGKGLVGAAKRTAASSASGAAAFGGFQAGEAKGTIEQRLEQVDPSVVVGGAIAGPLWSGIAGAGKLAKKGAAKVGKSKLVKMLAGRGAKPTSPFPFPYKTPPRPKWPTGTAMPSPYTEKAAAGSDVRKDIHRAIRYQRKVPARSADAAIAAGLTGAGAAAGGLVYATGESSDKKRKRLR